MDIKDRAYSALGAVGNRYPGLRRIFQNVPVSFSVGSAEGPGYAETFLPGENDRAGLGIDLRKAQNWQGRDLEDLITGEMLHYANRDPQFYSQKQQLIGSLSPRQWDHSNRVFQRIKNEGATGTNWESISSALNTALGDSLIRSNLLPSLTRGHPSSAEERALMSRGGGYFRPDQQRILDGILRYLQR